MKKWTKAGLWSLAGGVLGYISGFPIGTLLGSLLFVAIFQIKDQRFPKVPPLAKKAIQTLIGGNVGLAFNHDIVRLLKEIWPAVILIPCTHLIFSLAIAFVLQRKYDIPPMTAILSSVPAGFSEMAVLCDKYRVPATSVLTVHLFRIVCIVAAIPVIVYWLTAAH